MERTGSASRTRRTIAAALLGTTVLSGAIAVSPALNAAPITAPAPNMPGSFAPLVKKVSPAVVTVTTTGRTETAEAGPDFRDMFPNVPGFPFEKFFEQFRGDREGRRSEGPGMMRGLGSGFVIDSEGYIVTNNHVVDGAKDISVTLDDGAEFKAKVVGRDSKTDLALLKIDAKRELPYLQFGDSSSVNVGDWIVAVGNPYGLGGTVTAGIVSARGRDLHSGPYDDFIQVDAPINRGNSGGPTFDVNGEVIGINSAIYSPSGGSIGIGFAIPSNLAKPIIAQLKEHGQVERGWLGVNIQQVTPSIADSLGLSKAEGALVAGVVPESPAAAAGIKQGDVVIGFGGKSIDTPKALSRSVAEARTGSKQTLEVWRDGTIKQLSVSLGELPKSEQVADAGGEATGRSGEVEGLKLARLSPENARRFGVEGSTKGVLVLDVEATRIDTGIRPGDVITDVAAHPVSSPNDVKRRLDAAKADGKKAVLVKLNRDGKELFLGLPVNAA